MIQPREFYVIGEKPFVNVSEKTEAGIVKSAEMFAQEVAEAEKNFKGVKVISVGKNIEDIKEGDTVILRNTSMPVLVDDRYLIINQGDIIAIRN